jgi:hypothetical protein
MKKMYKNLVIISCLFILTSLSLLGNTVNQTINGKVTDAITGSPLIGANVVLLNSNPIIGTTVDLNGNFELHNIPLGRQALQISYLGYRTQTIHNLLVTSGKQTQISIQLEEDITQVDEVVINGKTNKDRPINEMATVSARTFSIEETERFAGSLGDPARMVANYAGVATQNDARNDIIIRGNSPSGVLWRLEGIEIPNPNHFGALGTTGGPVSMINNNLLTNSDFFTGAFPAEYGNALAGAFDLNLRSGNSRKTEFTGQVGFNGFEGGVEGPLFETSNGQKASYIANFRYSTLDVMQNIGFSMGTGTAIPEYKDFTFIVDVPGTKAGRFKLFGLLGDSYIELGRDYADSTDNSYNGRGTAINFGSGLRVVGASHTYFFNEDMKLKTTVSYQSTYAKTEFDSIIQRQYEKPYVRQDQLEDKLSLSTKFTYKISKKDNINLGFIADYYYIDYIDSIFDADYNRFLIGNDIQENLSMMQTYAQWQHKFTNELTVYGGLHLQYFNLNNEMAIEPRLGMQWQVNPQNSINLGFGKHSQTQPKTSYYEETYVPETFESFTTNEELKFTKSNHYVLGHNYLINQNFRLKSEAYFQLLYNVPVKESFVEFSMLNSGADFGNAREDSLVNKGSGTNMGLEFTIEKFLSNGYYMLFTTSLYDSRYKGYDGVERNTAFNGNYVFNLLGGYEYKLSEKYMLTFDLRTVLAGGKRYVPVDEQASQEQGTTVYDWSKAYEKKYDDYFRTDLRIGLKHNGKRFSQEWGLDLQNITNYQSIFMQAYDNEKNEMYNVYQQGFMPMMLYRIQF